MVIMAVALLSSPVFAEGDAGRESPFSLGAGARGMGMGRAFVALDGDASSPFWNAAALSKLDRPEVMAFHTSLFLDTNYDCLGLSYPFNEIGVFSLSVGRIGTDGIERRDEYNRLINEFSSSQSQFGVSYSRDVAYGFSGGLTLKAVTLDIGDDRGSGFGADFGLQYRPPFFDYVKLGVGLNDLIKPGVKLVSVEDKYQTIARFGLSSNYRVTKNAETTFCLDLEKSAGRNAKIRAGLEAAFYGQFALRAGLDDGRVTFGAGILYNFVRLDYAYQSMEYLGGSHRVSVAFSFGRSLSQAREAARARIVKEEKERWVESLQTERRSEASALIAAADSLRELGEYNRALGYYQRAAVLDESSEVATARADTMMEVVIDRAISGAGDEKRRELIAGRVESALTDYRSGRLNQALTKCDLLLEIDPGNQEILDLKNTIDKSRGETIADLRKSARASQNAGDFVSAVSSWNRLLALDPTDGEARASIDSVQTELKVSNLVTRAVYSMENGRYERAVGYLDQADKLRPGNTTVETLLAEARVKSAPLTTLDDIKSSPERWEVYISGLESYQAGDYENALRYWRSLREFYPNNPELEKNIDQAEQRRAAESGTPQE
jgi:tetratricopeptide (TPR) repeat protein